MTDATTSSLKPGFSPFGLPNRSLGWQTVAALGGTLFLALASYIEVPMIPVPMTMQTFAVTLIGALYGWRLGAITILAWLAEAALGLPVLAGGAGGAHLFLGPTGGYLFAFPIVGALTGWLAERGWNGNKAGLAFVAMILGNTACLLLGAAWLAAMIGVEQAIMFGVTPFLLGGLLKSALGAATLAALVQAKAGRAAR